MQIDIKKIIVAGISWLALYPHRLLMVSILPLLLIIPFAISMFDVLADVSEHGMDGLIQQGLPLNVLLYGLFASFGYSLLSINIYRLVILGPDNVSKYGSLYPNGIWAFTWQLFTIQTLLILPAVLTGLNVFYVIIYFLITPMFLQLVDIALGQVKQKRNINYNNRASFVLIQAIIPLLLLIIISYMPNNPFTNILFIAIKIILIYYEMITLSLIYKNTNDNKIC